jgi:hypothetical protein
MTRIKSEETPLFRLSLMCPPKREIFFFISCPTKNKFMIDTSKPFKNAFE